MHTDDWSIGVWVLYQLRWALAAIVALVIISTAAYIVVEEYTGLDAFYMAVITLGTIGYGEVEPLTPAGRLLTVGIIVAGFATLVYMASVLTNLFASGEAVGHIQARRNRRMCEELDHHVIVVGFGRVGRAVIRAFTDTGKRCLVIDHNPDHEADITAAGAVHLVGDATVEDDLRRAGIERAEALVATADQDSENLVVVLTARSVRADLRIVARVNQATWLKRMRAAGADVAESPYERYGVRLATAALSDGA